MKSMKKLIGVLLCMAMLASVSACGKKTEETPDTPAETTTAAETTSEDTTAEETTEAETTEAETTEDVTTEDVTTAADETTETAAASAEGTTSAAGETTTANAETQAPTTAAPAETQATAPVPTEAPAPQSNDNPISFSYNGGTLVLGESAQAFTAAVPANSEESSPSCLGNGEDINYYYNDFTIIVWNDNGSYKTVAVDITGAGASTSRGITIGSTAEQVIAAYGNDYTERNDEFVYNYDNNCHLGFTLNDGVVTFISYNQDN